MAIDPVCGMEVDENTAEYSTKYGDQMYYFDSAFCRESFLRDPEAFIGPNRKPYEKMKEESAKKG